MSTEPQSRVSLDGPSNGLVTQFDLYLRVISDRYLGFFLERSVNHSLRHPLSLPYVRRRRIEET